MCIYISFACIFVNMYACSRVFKLMKCMTWGWQKLPSEAKQAQILLKSSQDGATYEDAANSPTSTICFLKKVHIGFWRDGKKPTNSQCCAHSSSGPRAQGWNAAANGRDVYRLGWSRAGHVHKARPRKASGWGNNRKHQRCEGPEEHADNSCSATPIVTFWVWYARDRIDLVAERLEVDHVVVLSNSKTYLKYLIRPRPSLSGSWTVYL